MMMENKNWKKHKVTFFDAYKTNKTTGEEELNKKDLGTITNLADHRHQKKGQKCCCGTGMRGNSTICAVYPAYLIYFSGRFASTAHSCCFAFTALCSWPRLHQPRSVQFSSVQFSSVQFSSIQFSSVQFSSVQFSSVQFSSVQSSPVQFRRGYLVWTLLGIIFFLRSLYLNW